MMSDNEKLIKKYEQEIMELQQMKPIDLTSADLSMYDADTREIILKCNDTMIKSISERIKIFQDMIKDLKQCDGDNGV